MADNLLYEQSSESQITTEPFVSRQVVYVVDQNNGSYNGQIQLDTSSLSNSGKYASYSEAYFEIPLVLTAIDTTPAAYQGGKNWADANINNRVAQAFMCGLKSGYWHLIHSFSVEYNNTSVVQLTPFSNMYIHYKMMTSMSREDVEKIGTGLGFWPDSATSIEFNCDATGIPTYDDNSKYGQGLGNNRDYGIFNLVASLTGQIAGGITLGEVVIGSAVAAAAAATAITTPAGGAGGQAAGTRVAVAGNLGIPIETRTTVNGVATPIDVTMTANSSLAQGYFGDRSNLGLYKRQQSIGYSTTTTTAPFSPYSAFLPTGNGSTAGTVGKNQFVQSIGTNPTNNVAWYILAKIRLKDLHDFFDKLPLIKGAYLRFIINTNTAQHTIRYNYLTASGNTSVNSVVNTVVGGTTPIMWVSGDIGQGASQVYDAVKEQFDAGAVNGTRDFTVRLSIGTDTTTTIQHPTLQQCRLYVPLYQMNPTMEEQYLSLNRTKKIVYRDIYQYQTNVNASTDFNVLLTNGIPNPKFIVTIPVLSQGTSTDGTHYSTGGTGRGNITGINQPVIAGSTAITASPLISPFATDPATTAPVALTNFNIQIAGQNMFIQNELYDFEQFTNELQSVNAINGGLVTGLTSGLISETDFQYLYRYYICDVSRRLPAEDRVPKSVQILGKNTCIQPITLYTFIEFEKEIEVDLKIRVCLAKSKASRFQRKRQHVQIAGNPSRCMILTFEGNFERAVVNHYRYSKKSYIIGQSASKHLSPLW